jgi:predicted short-subunit dehydrogenase-like oxidoreductase (DUF2520 family)
MTPTEPLSLGIIGGGRAAWAFGSAWRLAGWEISGVALREGSASPLADLLHAPLLSNEELAARSSVLLLAVSDRAIEAVAASVASSLPAGSDVFHVSGSLPSTAIPHPRAFSLHPFRALPPVGQPVTLAGALLVFEGPDASLGLATRFAEAAGARIARIAAAQKPVYHAAAVLAANDVAALLDLSSAMLAEMGLQDLDGEIAALADTAIVNWLTAEGPARFTGPIARGDYGVLRRHVEALQAQPERAELYRLLALEITRAIARQSGPRFDARLLIQRVREALSVP